MGNRNTVIYGDQIDDTVLGAGLVKNVSDDFTHKLDVNVDDSSIEIDTNIVRVKASGVTNDMLAGSIADGKLLQDYIQTSEVDDSTIEFGGGSLNVKALGINTAELANEAVTEGKIAIFNSPTIGEYLKFTSNGMEWIALSTEFVEITDVVTNEIPTGLINSSNTDYDLANTPVEATVEVYLNGIFQAQGAGLDYELNPSSGQTETIVFSKAPRTNSDIYVSYIINN
jgi:hypothetical protein